MNNTPDGANDATSIDPARLAANWRAITIELDIPRPARIERLLRAVGVPAHATRLVAATPALRRSWYLAVAGAIFVALTAADPDAPRQSVLLFLTIAPLVAVLGVALAYGPSADSAHELHVATPMPGLRVLAVRTLVVSVVSSVAIVGCTALNAVTRPFAAAWLLPAVAVTASLLALMTAMAPRRAATVVGIAWCSVVVVSQVGTDPLVVFTASGQATALVVAAIGVAVTVRRREAFDRLVVPG